MLKHLILLLFCFTFLTVYSKKNELDSIFRELDKAMENKSIYIERKEKRIAELKKMFSTPNLTQEQRFQVNNNLYSEYSHYNPDSAKVFIYDNIRIAQELDSTQWLVRCKLDLVRHYSSEGLYIDAVNALDSIRPDAYAFNLMSTYYSVYKQLYSFYLSQNSHLREEYFNYQDSLLMVTEENTLAYLLLTSEKLIDAGHMEEGRALLVPLFEKEEDGSHMQAKLANTIGKTYRGGEDYNMQKKYFAISAIADIKSGIREHESFRSLAITCYETNDIDRAYKYISQSMEDAIFTNFNMRMIEASQFFPIIEKSYQAKLQAEKDRFFYLATLTSIIAFFLIIGIIYIYLQMSKLTAIRKNLATTNKQLNEINEDMRRVNKDLSEANLLKETYITQFLHVCSLYVKKMEKYQNSLNKKLMEQKMDELNRMLKSRDMVESELKELHELFDKIFLSLYPNFVDEVNNLLPESEQFNLRSKESMTTELRIFALIRLGITDSSAIAKFLHNSIKTIYNYRTRLRNKSVVSGDEFEERIKQIDIR